jgi:translation initiation factor IF-3
MDYSKFRYEQNKRAKEAKKNQKIISVKEVRLSPTIDVGDYETKSRAARKFIEGGDKVKVSCRFRGRMIEQANNTKDLFVKFAEKLSDIAQVDQQPTLDGRNMFMVLSPKMQKKKK